MSGTLIYSRELDFSKLTYWEISQYFDSAFLIVQIKDYNGGYSASMGKLWTIPFIPGFGDTRYSYQEISEGFNLIQSPGVSQQWKFAIQPFAKVVKLRVQIFDVSDMPLISKSETGSSVATSANVTSMNAATQSTVLLAANANRKKCIVINESTATLYLAYGEAASLNEYTIALSGGDGYELEGFTGVVSAIWSAATGKALLTEFE